MPHRALAITSQHHPVAMACYAFITVLGVMYLTGVASAASMVSEVGEHVTLAWQIFLLLGGVLALFGALLSSKRFLLKSLLIECVGAGIIGVELGIYAGVLSGLDAIPWASVIAFSFVAIGCLCRCYTARRDRIRVIKAAIAMKPASPVPLGEADE